MKYKVGDEIVIKVFVRKIYEDNERYMIDVGEDEFFIFEDDLLQARVLSKEERKKEIQEQMLLLQEELESIK